MGSAHHSLREHPIMFAFGETGSSPILVETKTENLHKSVNSLFGASVHKGFTQNISKTGFKHSILHILPCLLFFFKNFIELLCISSDYGINNCPNHQVNNNKNAGKN